ncbi:MAG: tetratricopeptide repeat protein, partial [Candidatus Binatia bacterium]
LATARYSLKQYAPAADAFQKNVELNNNGFAMYNLACVYSLMGDKDKAIEWLTRTIDNPKMVLPALDLNDPDLTNIKDDARFKVLTEKVGRQIHPCLYSDQAKEFNFWVGEWDVYNPQGRHDGTSSIQSISNGCGLLENWTDAFGNTGKSINFYDPNDRKWYQYWIGSGGGPLRYSGVYKDRAIRYEGETVDKAGRKTLTRLTFFNLDVNTVRQLAENSTDDGKTWTTGYDYKYIRKK